MARLIYHKPPQLLHRLLLRLLLFGLLNTSVSLAVEPMPILLVPLKENLAEPDAQRWELTVNKLFTVQLRTVSDVRILPASAIDYAFRQSRLDRAAGMTQENAWRLAASVSAKRALSGSFDHDSNHWRLRLQVWPARENGSAKLVDVSSTNLSRAVFLAATKVLDVIGIASSANESARMSALVTESAEALDLLSRAGMQVHEGTLSNATIILRRVLALEPRFLLARNLLAQCLVYQDRSDEAREIAKATVGIYPEHAEAHLMLGVVCFFSKLYTVARDEFKEAVRLCPTEVEAYTRLADVHFHQQHWSDAINSLKKAKALAPYQADIHAQLGLTYAKLDHRLEALTELSISESLAVKPDLGVSQFLAYGYDALDDAPRAIEFYEKFLAATSQEGMGLDVTRSAKKRVEYLRLRLTPRSFKIAPPQNFTSAQLESFLRRRLRPDEYSLVRNPLSTTLKIEAFARKLTRAGTNDIEKAKLIFSWMTNRVDADGPESRRTAAQVFEDWTNSATALHCQDYTYLYIALARAAGVKAHLASVTINYSERVVSHVCPAVFIGEQAFLVDPAYSWFGVPHREFDVEDDLGVIGGFMAQLDNTASENVGLKLVGKWTAPYFWVFQHRLSRNETDAAFQTIREVLSFDRTSYYGVYAQALIAEHEERWKEAADGWKRCLEIRPQFNDAHIGLARALAEQKNFLEAREQWKLYLQGDTDPKLAADVLEAIAKVDESLAETVEKTVNATNRVNP